MWRAVIEPVKHLAAWFFLIAAQTAFSQDVQRTNVSIYINDQKITSPFVGGMLSPQFSEPDLNIDGVPDLLVFDRVGDVLMPFVRDPGEIEILNYAPEYLDIFPETKAWILMRDYNHDGIQDIFKCPTVPGIPGVEVWKGLITDDQLHFQLVENEDQVYDIIYIPISNGFTQVYVSIIDIPAIEDVDGDGDLDILSFEPGGTKVTFYKNMTVENEVPPDRFDFRLVDNCFGKFQESGFSQDVRLSQDPGRCASFFNPDPDIEVRHSGSTILAFDENGDFLIDLLLGDLANSGLVLLKNGGTLESAWMNEQDNMFPSYDVTVDIDIYISPFYIDVNWDGKRDLVVAPNELNSLQNRDHVWFYENVNTDEDPEFRLQQKDFLLDQMLHFGTNSNPCFTDFNQDGLMDFIVGTQGYRNSNGLFVSKLYLFENRGTAEIPEFHLVDEDYLDFSEYSNASTNFAPTVGDLDGDNDLDMVVGDGQGYLYYLENQAGEGNLFQFTNPVYKFFDINVGQQVKPFIFDFNEDGLGDLVIGERNFNTENGDIGSLNYLENEGEVGNPVFSDTGTEGNTEIFGKINLKSTGFINNYSAPTVVKSGEDFILLTGSEGGFVSVYDNIRGKLDGAFHELSADLGIQEGVRATPSAADIDNDGYLELLVGNLRGGLALYDTDIQIEQTVSTDQSTNEAFELKLYPNPGTDFLHLETTGNETFGGVEIVNSSGAVILREQASGMRHLINTQKLDTGIYFVIAHFQKGKHTLIWVKI